jgi:benzoate/toluate 1,2-dioxygenase reductase subunit
MSLNEPEASTGRLHTSILLDRRRLTERTMEIELTRPSSFDFAAGQRIRFIHHSLERDYSLISTPTDSTLALCVRIVEGGVFSSLLASAPLGRRFSFTGPHGYFTFRPSGRPAVFIATGTGIAPFVSMARSGAAGFILLHGVKAAEDLYYESLFRDRAKRYIPCLSGEWNQAAASAGAFRGRVTDYLERNLPSGVYDFYLCGRLEMVRDVILLVDETFPGSFVFTEIFY